MADYTLVIDGKSVATDNAFPVINPATGEPFAECPDCSRSQLEAAMEAAQRAFRPWASDEQARRDALLASAAALTANADAIGELLTREQGKPLKDAIGEVHGAAFWLQHTAGLEIPGELLHEDDEQKISLRRRPLGVVAAITPWNFPVILAMWKIASGLLAGNTIVLKPSPFTPLSSLEMGRVMQSALPPGVLNVVSGGDELGKWVSDHPVVRKISFTGSVATGKKIAAVAAPDLKRITLELGGNDPAIVLADVDPEAIAEKLFWGAFNNAGQICIAVKRVYAEEPVYGAIVDALAEKAKSIKPADGLEPETLMGPINNRPQFERVNELIASAHHDGAKFVAGGVQGAGPGYFIEPSICTGIEDGTQLVDVEQFGPVRPIIKVKSAEDAIARANATHFGLGGSVWTSDVDRGVALAEQLECGTGWVNQHGALSPFAPFGGNKWSGIGYENGPWGLEAFTEYQVLSVAKG
jgi:acyl-CoA reductase-like NAD-dependent aldehyde dehydrogenase